MKNFSRIASALFTLVLFVLGARADENPWQKEMAAGADALERGKYTDAERLLRGSVKRAEAFGKDDPRLGEAQTALAYLYLKQGRYAEADRLAERAQALLEKSRGREHEAVAHCLNLRARICGVLGPRAQAVRLARQSYDISVKKFGKDHLETAEPADALIAFGGDHDVTTTENAVISHGWDRAERSLHIREKQLGKDHPDVAASLMALASRPYATDSDTKYVVRALEILKKAYGEVHPEVADCFTLLARLLAEQEKFREMEEAQNKALELWREIDPTSPRAAPGLYNLAQVHLARRQYAEAERLFAKALRLHFSRLSDQDLCHYFDRADWKGHFLHESELAHAEAYLTEMKLREGPIIAQCLADSYRNRLAQQTAREDSEANGNLEVLTVLRRLQEKPDPLTISVTGSDYREAIFPLLPTFEVALTNEDCEERSFGFQQGGDYRSGRLERWRFEVTDAAGRKLPVKPIAGGDGGGLYAIRVLKFGESWQASLPMNSYVDLPPGEYTVRICYHDHVTISGLESLAGLVLFRSQPIRLTVQPRVIDLGQKDKKEIAEWLAKLDAKAELKLIGGPLRPGTKTDVFPDDSPPCRLLSYQWKAVPALLDELTKERLDPQRRAWVLTLLHTITGNLDPVDADGILPNYEYHPLGWAVSFGKGAGGFGFTEPGKRESKIDEQKQQAFAKRWEAYRDFIVVRERP